MPGIVTRRFRLNNADQFYESFSEASPNYMYMYIGRVTAWDGGDVPTTPTDTITNARYEPWRDMIAAKRVTSADVSYSTDRHNWTTGTVYVEYDNTSTTMYDNQFYVVTSDYNVYKCMFNNYGAQSTVQPTGTGATLITTSDGYIWKYMYSISAAETLKFVTTDYVPVKTLTSDDGSTQWTVQQAAVNGAIEIIRLTANGTGYVARTNTLASVTNSSVMVLDGSASGTDNFYTGASLFISAGLGSGQVQAISAYNGTSKLVTLSTGFTVTPNSSSTFHIGPNITISGDGSGATAYANVAGGILNKVTMVNVGTNYSRASVSFTDGNGGSGAGAAATARISPPGGHGSDPIGELAGHNVMLNVRLSGTESGDFPTNNEFRIIGLLKDPLLANGSSATATSYDQTSKLTVTGISSGPFQLDEQVTGGTTSAQGRVVSFANTNASGTNGILSLVNVFGSFGAETVTGNTTSASATSTTFTGGELQVNKGDVLYIENRGAISRAPDQIEDIKLVVRY
jgi:hypothetical protein